MHASIESFQLSSVIVNSKTKDASTITHRYACLCPHLFDRFLIPLLPDARCQFTRVCRRVAGQAPFSHLTCRVPSPLTASATAFTPAAASTPTTPSPAIQASTPPPQAATIAHRGSATTTMATLPDSPLVRAISPPVTITHQALNAPVFVPRTAVAVATGVSASARKAAMSPLPFNKPESPEFLDEFPE